MTIERIYRCDLCRDGIKADDSDGIGLHFNTGRHAGFDPRAVSSCEHHLCLGCARSLVGAVSAALRARGEPEL